MCTLRKRNVFLTFLSFLPSRMLVVCSMGHDSSRCQRQLFFYNLSSGVLSAQEMWPIRGPASHRCPLFSHIKTQMEHYSFCLPYTQEHSQEGHLSHFPVQTWVGIWGRSWSFKAIINLTSVFKQLLAYFSCVNRKWYVWFPIFSHYMMLVHTIL